MWVETIGWIDCYPHKTGNSKKPAGEGWLFIRIDNERDFFRYYRWLIYEETYRRVLPSQWGCHITLVTHHEKHKIQTDVAPYHMRRIQFEYNTDLQTDGGFWWLPVRSLPAFDVRQELGLPRQRHVRLHLTVACEKINNPIEEH